MKVFSRLAPVLPVARHDRFSAGNGGRLYAKAWRWAIPGWSRTTVLGALVLFACGLSNPANAIYLGAADLTGQYSGVGMILPTPGHASCTAAMLSDTVLLTAAQCVYDLTSAADLQFSLGPGMTAHATEIRTHPGFNTPDGLNLPYDIALVALDKADVAFWAGIAYLTIGTDAPPGLSPVTALGFGESQTGVGTGQRRSGNLSVTQYIGAEAPVGVFLPDAFIETVPGDLLGQTFCLGDAGGPLLYNNAIVGTASFRTVATCNEAGPGYYLNIHNFAGWISDNLSAMDPPRTVPEPATLALFAFMLAGLGFGRGNRSN
jgi:hypothetical protein